MKLFFTGDCDRVVKLYKFQSEVCSLTGFHCMDDGIPNLELRPYEEIFHHKFMSLTNEILVDNSPDVNSIYDLVFNYEFDEAVHVSPQQDCVTQFWAYFVPAHGHSRYRECKPLCRDQTDVIPHISNCSLYYTCEQSEPILQRCPWNRVFNSNIGKCLYFEKNCLHNSDRYSHCRYSEL